MSETAFAGRHTCDSPEWYTPSPFVEAAREVMGGIDLDPASHDEANQTVKAALFFTADDDGLRQSWAFGARRVFLNPPGGLVAAFWNKLLLEWQHARVSQAIWIGYSLEQLQTLQRSAAGVTPLDYPMCVTAKRIPFVENEAKRVLRLANIDADNIIRLAEGKKSKRRSEKADSPSHSNYITYIGANTDAFRRAFSAFGRVRA